MASLRGRGRSSLAPQVAQRAEPPWEAVRELYRALRGVGREALRPHGLLFSEFQTLSLLERAPVPLKVVTQALGVTPAATTDLVRRLARRRLVAVSPHPSDRRSRVVGLTRLGETRLAAARRSYAGALEGLGARLSPASSRGLRRAVRELRESMVGSATAS